MLLYLAVQSLAREAPSAPPIVDLKQHLLVGDATSSDGSEVRRTWFGSTKLTTMKPASIMAVPAQGVGLEGPIHPASMRPTILSEAVQ